MKTVQWYIIEENLQEFAKRLLKDPDLCNAHLSNSEYSILMFASAVGHTEVVKLLLENGVDIYTQDNSGNNVLHMVITELKDCNNEVRRNNYYEIIRMILEHEVKLDCGKTPLLDTKNKSGYTPLWTVDSPVPGHQKIKNKILQIAKDVRDEAKKTLAAKEEQWHEGLHRRELYSETPPDILKAKPAPKERGCFACFFQALGFGGDKPAEEDERFLLKVK